MARNTVSTYQLPGDPTPRRICYVCKQEFPLTSEHFYKNNTDKNYGLAGACKQCAVKNSNEWRRAHPERFREHVKAYRAKLKVLYPKPPKTVPASRECGKCRSVLPLDAEHFYRDKEGLGGRSSVCKPCTRTIARQRYAMYRDAYLASLEVSK